MLAMFKQQDNIRIYNLFKAITKGLNQAGIRPITYGSLGLYLLIGERGDVSDIDLLISSPNDFDICKDVAVEHGFSVDLDHDRELGGNNTFISFLELNKIEKLIGTNIQLQLVKVDEIEYYNLSPEAYLDIYKAGLKNKYRKEKKEADDLVKIEQIKTYIRAHG